MPVDVGCLGGHVEWEDQKLQAYQSDHADLAIELGVLMSDRLEGTPSQHRSCHA